MTSRKIPGALTALVLMVLFVVMVPARAATFGFPTPGASVSSGLTADFKRGSRFTLTEAGTLQSLCAYLDFAGGGAGPQQVRLALYRDASGVPGAKVVDSDSRSLTTSSPVGWTCFDTALYPIAAGSYWIVIHSGGAGGLVRDYFAPGGTNWYGNADAFGDGAASTFGSGNAGTGTLSVYAKYFSSSENLLRTFGKTTVGANPSKGMTADFKRASSFTLTEGGELQAFTVYLDGLGGGTNGIQYIQIALYRDANGAPGGKVTESIELQHGVVVGAPARWMTFPAIPALVEPGRYWMAIVTTSWEGTGRNYSDPTGSWAGNANLCCTPSFSFGPASIGTGTISVFALYKPGFTGLHQFGRTDAGRQPSKGLSANYARGSSFTFNPNDRGVLTALYAYLDGNGGATGSQQVRMQMYAANAEEHDIFLRAQSEIVSIPAGTPPGWMRFPVNAVDLAGNYIIMIESGNNAGVVRDYGDGPPANWTGVTDGGFPGVAQFFDPGTHEPGPVTGGDVTLSVYGEYFVPR